MKQTKSSESWLSGLSTPLLGVFAILATLYTYGAVQNWSFLKTENNLAQLKWERDFVDHLDKCNHSPSSLEICNRAFQKTVNWVKAQRLSEERIQLRAPAPLPQYPARSVRELKMQATALAERIPLKLESKATLIALNSWMGQIDRYTQLVDQPETDFKSRSWQLISAHAGVATIRIANFDSPDLCGELKTTLKRLQNDDHIHSLRIDLRGNPGGRVTNALCLGDMLVPKGSVLARFEKIQTRLPFAARPVNSLMSWIHKKFGVQSFVRKATNGMIYTKSLEVILDRRSASAAELLAASLKDTGRARILGEKSYGKSAVQSPGIFDDLGGIKGIITTHHWYSPLGTSVSRTKGITPDQSLTL